MARYAFVITVPDDGVEDARLFAVTHSPRGDALARVIMSNAFGADVITMIHEAIKGTVDIGRAAGQARYDMNTCPCDTCQSRLANDLARG